MYEMYSAYMTEVDKDLKENLTESREFIHWKKTGQEQNPFGEIYNEEAA